MGDGTQRPRESWLSKLWSNERGQGLIEYILIIATVSLAAVAALGLFSGKIQDVFFKSGNTIQELGRPASGTIVRGPGPVFTIFNTCDIGNTYVWLDTGRAEDNPINGFLSGP